MKALSVNQPWATMIVNGFKPVENRDWYTPFRGTVLIHAGLKFDMDGYNWICKEFPQIYMPEPFLTGGIIGQADIVDCVMEMDSPWFFGKHGFVLRNAKACDLRPCKGALGFFTPDYNSRYVEKKPAPARAPEDRQTKLL